MRQIRRLIIIVVALYLFLERHLVVVLHEIYLVLAGKKALMGITCLSPIFVLANYSAVVERYVRIRGFESGGSRIAGVETANDISLTPTVRV